MISAAARKRRIAASPLLSMLSAACTLVANNAVVGSAAADDADALEKGASPDDIAPVGVEMLVGRIGSRDISCHHALLPVKPNPGEPASRSTQPPTSRPS
jgi:hypothetical protein